MTAIEIILEEVEKFVDDIRADLGSKNFTDTGKASESLRIEESGNTVNLYGINYYEWLNRGSRPWDGDPVENARILGNILQESGWASRRGINPYAAAHVIVTKGSQVARGERKGLEMEEKLEILRQNILSRLVVFGKENIRTILNERFKKAYKIN